MNSFEIRPPMSPMSAMTPMSNLNRERVHSFSEYNDDADADIEGIMDLKRFSSHNKKAQNITKIKDDSYSANDNNDDMNQEIFHDHTIRDDSYSDDSANEYPTTQG